VSSNEKITAKATAAVVIIGEKSSFSLGKQIKLNLL
jgi:hypothetical protein